MNEIGELIGFGKDKKVYLDKAYADKVIVIYNPESMYKPFTAEQVKAIYYFQKIKHYLFPDNFPNIHAAVNGKDVYLISERIDDPYHQAYSKRKLGKPLTEEELKKATEFEKKMTSETTKAEIKRVVALFEKAGIFWIDLHFSNWARGDNGALINLDTELAIFHFTKMYDEEKLKSAIEMIADPKRRRQASSYLSRLNQLFEEERKKAQTKKF